MKSWQSWGRSNPTVARRASKGTPPLFPRRDQSGEELHGVALFVAEPSDVVIDRDHIRKRKKKPSKKFRADFGHTPLSIEEDLLWNCRKLLIGTGTGALPVMKEVKEEAKRHNIELVVLPTEEAIKALKDDPKETNAILHVTC